MAALLLVEQNGAAVAEEDVLAREVRALVPVVRAVGTPDLLVERAIVELLGEGLDPVAGDGRAPPKPGRNLGDDLPGLDGEDFVFPALLERAEPERLYAMALELRAARRLHVLAVADGAPGLRGDEAGLDHAGCAGGYGRRRNG